MPPHIVRSDNVNWYIVTSAGTWIIDKKGQVIGYVPEMPILRTELTALGAAIDVLQATQGMQGMSALRTQAAKAVASLAATVEKQTTAPAHGEVVRPTVPA